MTSNFVRKQVEKVLGCPMTQGLDTYGQPSRSFFARNETHTISFIDQGGQAICLKVRRTSDHDDLHSDYHAGSYFDTVKSAIVYWVRQ